MIALIPAWILKPNPYLLLTLTALFWSGNMVVARGLNESMPPMALAFFRWGIALLLILPFALPHLKAGWPALKRGWLALTVLGLLSVGSYNTLVYIGLQTTTATNASMLNSFIPVATMALAFVLLGKRLSRPETIGALISLSGVLLILSAGDVQTLLSLKLNTGDLWVLTAVLVWGLYTVGLIWRPAGVHPMLMLAAMTVVGLLALTPALFWEMSQGRQIAWSTETVLAVGYVATFPGFLGYVFYNAGVAAVGPSRGSLFIHLMPVFGTILAVIFLGEQPRWFHFLGILLVFSGIFLTTRRSS